MKEMIIKITAEHLDLAVDSVRPEANFMDDLGADSLDTVELVMAFEEEFDMEIPDEAAEKLFTVQDVIDYVEANG